MKKPQVRIPRKTLRRASQSRSTPAPQADDAGEGKVTPVVRVEQRWFHFAVDITTLAASIATVVVLVLLLLDRADTQDTIAWQLLQGYLQAPASDRIQADVGQRYALETLNRNHVRLDGLQADHVWLADARLPKVSLYQVSMNNANLKKVLLSGANMNEGSFRNATLIDVTLSSAAIRFSLLQDVRLDFCQCQNTNFNYSMLHGARFTAGDYTNASFARAEVSDMRILVIHPEMMPDLSLACYPQAHPPRFFKLQGGGREELFPSEPGQKDKNPWDSPDCRIWLKTWHELWPDESPQASDAP